MIGRLAVLGADSYLCEIGKICKMPVLKKIVVQNFRNIALQELEFSSKINCISGNNGEGKTNLLEAIWCLSMTKASFGGPDRYNFRYGSKSFALAGDYRMENGTVGQFAIEASEGEKKVRRDGHFYQRMSDHIGILPIVMVSPSDTTLVSESGEERRRFANSVLSQMEKAYLNDMQHYNQLLATRNTALKNSSPDPAFFDVVDYRLQEYGSRIHEARKKFAKALEPVVRHYYELLSGAAEEVGIEYRSDLDKSPLSELLARSREKDMVMGFTGVGVHRDDFVFTMNSHPIRKAGSQGQQKSFLVSLKFAQYHIMKDSYGFPPILLLDDLFDKLDMNRVGNLLKMVAGEDFGQIFITDSNKVRVTSLLDSITSEKACFEASGGVFKIV